MNETDRMIGEWYEGMTAEQRLCWYAARDKKRAAKVARIGDGELVRAMRRGLIGCGIGFTGVTVGVAMNSDPVLYAGLVVGVISFVLGTLYYGWLHDDWDRKADMVGFAGEIPGEMGFDAAGKRWEVKLYDSIDRGGARATGPGRQGNAFRRSSDSSSSDAGE